MDMGAAATLSALDEVDGVSVLEDLTANQACAGVLITLLADLLVVCIPLDGSGSDNLGLLGLSLDLGISNHCNFLSS